MVQSFDQRLELFRVHQRAGLVRRSWRNLNSSRSLLQVCCYRHCCPSGLACRRDRRAWPYRKGRLQCRYIVVVIVLKIHRVCSGCSPIASIVVHLCTSYSSVIEAVKTLTLDVDVIVDKPVMRFEEGVKTTRGVHKNINIVRFGRSNAINTAVVDVTMDELVNKRLGSVSRDSNARERTQGLIKEHQKVSEQLRSTGDQLNSG